LSNFLFSQKLKVSSPAGDPGDPGDAHYLMPLSQVASSNFLIFYFPRN